MGRTILICVAVLAIASSSFAATPFVFGRFNASDNNYIDWGGSQPYVRDLPSKYSFSTVGVTEGTNSLRMAAGVGWQQNLATRSYQNPLAGWPNGVVQGFLDSKYLAIDVTYVTADWVKTNPTGTDDWATIEMNIQGTNLGWEGMGRPDVDSGNPGYAGGWDARNFGAQHSRTMYWDVSYLHDGDFDNKEITATGTSGYLNLIMQTNCGGFTSGGVYYIDRIRWTNSPEPATIALLALGGLALRRRK